MTEAAQRPGAREPASRGSVSGEAAYRRIGEALAGGGLAVEGSFLDDIVVADLAAEALRHQEAGAFHHAGFGRGAVLENDTAVRGDRILWLDEASPAPAERPLWHALSTLRQTLNQTLYLGLFSVEAHYSIYPAGTFYRRHRDRFRDDDRRVLSCVLYLNRDWCVDDGGALRVYCADGVRDVAPVGGTLVCFLSDRFEHEVLPAKRTRMAVTAWFLQRA